MFFNCNKPQKPIKSDMSLTMLLWFIPIITLNIALVAINQINFSYLESQQEEAANIELKSMSATSDFDFQFSNQANAFLKFLSDLSENKYSEAIKNSIILEAEKLFAPPFPEHDLYVFFTPSNKTNSELIYKSISLGQPKNKQACKTFDYFIDLDKGKKNINSGRSFAKTFFKTTIDLEAYVQVKGNLTYAIYNSESNKFIWNYKENVNHENYGFFLFCKNDIELNKNARKLVLKEAIKNSYDDGNPLKNSIKAFIPFFKDYGEADYQTEKLKKSNTLQTWLKKIVPTNIDDIYKLETQELPTKIQLGNYKAYTYLGKAQSHLCLLLVPSLKSKLPQWAYIFNMIYVSILFIVILRGKLFGKWTKTKLKQRFAMCFILSASVPLSIFAIGSHMYILQTQNNEYQSRLKELELSLSEFESLKEQFISNYIDLFRKNLKDKELENLLISKGSAKGEDVKEKIVDLLIRKSKLPIDNISILDEQAIGNNFQIKIINEKTNFINAQLNKGLIYPICRSLGMDRAKAKGEKYDDSKLPKSILETTDESLYKADKFDEKNYRSLSQHFSQQRKIYFTSENQAGNKRILCFDYIYINGIPEYVALVSWKDEEISRLAFNYFLSEYGVKNSQFAFKAFRNNENEVKEIEGEIKFKIPQDPKIKLTDINRIIKSLVKTSALQNKQIAEIYNNVYILIYPSKNFNNYILVAACSLEDIHDKIFFKKINLSIVAIISLVIVIFFIYVASKIIIMPISVIKSAINKVYSGNFNISLISNSRDELSRLCSSFSDMIKGLREKETLATLISDQAMYAINSGSLESEAFNGVALVTDIRNFTGISEANEPNIITDLLNRHFTEMTLIISSYGGRIYKYIGDAIEAIFPESENEQNSASMRAVMAACQMLEKLKEINKSRENSGLFAYKIGIGLKYGIFYSGTVGSTETRLDYAIIGDTLKKAAKLESLSTQKPDFPLITDENIKKELEKNGIEFEPLSNSEIKAYSITKILYQNKKTEQQARNDSVSYDFEILQGMPKLGFIGSNISYLIFMLILGVILFSFYGSFKFIDKLKQSYLETRIYENNKGIISQIKKDKNSKLLYFEYACRKEVCKIQNYINTNSKTEIIKQELNNYKSNDNINRYFLYNEYNDSNEKIALKENFNESSLTFNDAKYKDRISDMRNIFELLKSKLQDKKQKASHVNFGISHLRSIGFEAKLYDEKIISDEYIYWDFIYSNKTDGAGNFLPTGFIFFSQENDKCVSLKTILDSFNYEKDSFFAYKIENADWVYSENYNEKNQSYIIKDERINYEDYIITDDLSGELSLNNIFFKLIIATKKNQNNNIENIIVFAMLLFAIFIGFVTRNIIQNKSIINKSLVYKLRLSLLCSAFVPIISLIPLFEILLIENEANLFTYQKKEIQNFAQNFENKAYLKLPLTVKQLEKYTSDKNIIGNIKQFDSLKNLSEASLSSKNELEQLETDITNSVVLDNITSYAFYHKLFNPKRPNKLFSNFVCNTVIISGNNWLLNCFRVKNGREKNRKDSNKKDSSISKIFEELAKSMFNEIFESKNDVSKNSIKNMASGAKLEEVLEAARDLFGIKTYIKTSNFFNLPNYITVGHNSFISYMKIFPSMKNPICAFAWILIQDTQQFEYIARTYNDENSNKLNYKIYPVDLKYYGKGDIYNGDPSLMAKIKHQISFKSKDKNSVIKSGNKTLLYCINSCSNIPNYNLLAFKDLTPDIQKFNVNYRLLFYFTIFLLILLVLFISHNVAKDILYPVKLLTNGIKKINNEDYSHRINLIQNDELGEICEAFDVMTKSLEEKQLMSKMVSKTASQTASNANTTSSKKTKCVLMYLSIPNFVEYTELVSANALLNDLKRHVALIAETVNFEGGEIDKIMAEKQLAVFYSNCDNLQNAVKAACKVAIKIKRLEFLNQIPFPVSIGITCGVAVTGFLGAGNKRDFTVIGDPVNVSARIASYGEKQISNRCLISETVYEMVKNHFESQFAGEISLKGKSKPMKLYNLVDTFSNK